VGKENRNYSTIHKEIILALNLYCNILNSFVLPSGMLLRFFPTKLSGADRKIHTIEIITIQPIIPENQLFPYDIVYSRHRIGQDLLY